jgi:hypothetical protein
MTDGPIRGYPIAVPRSQAAVRPVAIRSSASAHRAYARVAGHAGELRGGAGLLEQPQDAGAVRADEAGQAVGSDPGASGLGERAGHGVDEVWPMRLHLAARRGLR